MLPPVPVLSLAELCKFLSGGAGSAEQEWGGGGKECLRIEVGK